MNNRSLDRCLPGFTIARGEMLTKNDRSEEAYVIHYPDSRVVDKLKEYLKESGINFGIVSGTIITLTENTLSNHRAFRLFGRNDNLSGRRKDLFFSANDCLLALGVEQSLRMT